MFNNYYKIGIERNNESYKTNDQIINQSLERPDQRFFILVPDQYTMQTQKDVIARHPKNGMINMSAEAATSLIVSIGFGIFINLLWIVDSKTWITDYGKRKCIWSYWCGEIVLLLLVVALENMNQLVATSAILGMMAVYLIIGIWWVSRKL